MRPALLLLGLVLLHRPDGTEAWFKAEEINYIGVANKSVWGKQAETLVLIHDAWMAVTEKPREVLAKIESEGK